MHQNLRVIIGINKGSYRNIVDFYIPEFFLDMDPYLKKNTFLILLHVWVLYIFSFRFALEKIVEEFYKLLRI